MGGVRRSFRVHDRTFGAQIRNQPRGIILPFVERVQLGIAQRQHGYDQDAAIVDDIDEDAHVLSQLYDSDLIQRVWTGLKPYIRDDDRATVTAFEGQDIRRTVDSDKVDFSQIDGFEELLQNTVLRKTVRSYFGADFRSTYSTLLQYRPIPPNVDVEDISDTQHWHMGFASAANTVRLLIFLTDETNGGPLELISASQTEDLLKQYSPEELEQNPDIVKKNADVHAFKYDKGSALLFNPVTQLHRGRPPSEGERRVLAFSLVPRTK